MKARGASMIPFLLDGDVVTVSPAGGGEVGVGDIVCFAPPWAPLCLHRVIRRGAALVVKGDAVAFSDLVAPEEVMGKVVAVERHGRTRRLDTAAARATSRLVAALSPVLWRLVPPAIALRRVVRSVLRGSS